MIEAVLFMVAPVAVLAFAFKAAEREERLRRDRLIRAARRRAQASRPWQAPGSSPSQAPAYESPKGREDPKADGSFLPEGG